MSPSALEAREGQNKVDLVKALKNRLYGIVKQNHPDELNFRQTLRDLRKAWNEIERDHSGAILGSTKDHLEMQVNKAIDKAMERLRVLNPDISSIAQVEDIEGNPPKKGQVPSGTFEPPTGAEESEGVNSFETVTGLPQGSRASSGEIEPRPGSSREEHRDTVPPKEKKDSPVNGMEVNKTKGKAGKKHKPKNSKTSRGIEDGGVNRDDMSESSSDKLAEELRKAEIRIKELQRAINKKGESQAEVVPNGATMGPRRKPRDTVNRGREPRSRNGDEVSLGSFRTNGGNARKKDRGRSGNPTSSSTPFGSSNGVNGFRRRCGEETFGHWGDLDDSEEEDGHIDWGARVAKRKSLGGLKFPKGWEIPPPHIMKRYFRQIDFSKEVKRGTLKPFLGTLGDFPRFKAMFYENVQVQDASVLAKCEALDFLMPDDLVEKMFFGLSVSGVDYVTRIERLVRRFEREDVYRDNLLLQLRKLQLTRGENEEVLERSIYAIKTFMDNVSYGERSSRWLLDILEDHLPEGMLRQYNFDLRMHNYKHSATRLSQWLELYLESLMDTRQMKRGLEDSKKRAGSNKDKEQVHLSCASPTEVSSEGKAHAAQESNPETMGPCVYCKKGHDIYHCPSFFSLTPSGRRKALDKFSGCYLCLKTGHFISDCSSKLKCRFCGGKHNSSVHLIPVPDSPTQEGASFSGEEERTSKTLKNLERPKLPMEIAKEVKNDSTPRKEKVSGLTQGKKEYGLEPPTEAGKGRSKPLDGETAAERLAAKEVAEAERAELRHLVEVDNSLATLVVAIGPNRVKVNALLDSGADNASLDAGVASRCGFQPVEVGSYSVKVGGGRVNTYAEVGLGFLEVAKPDDTYRTKCVVRTYPKPVGQLQPINWAKKKMDYAHLKDLPITEPDEQEPVTLLLGTRNPQLFEILDVRRGAAYEPWGFLTPLGWVIVGPVASDKGGANMVNLGHNYVGKERLDFRDKDAVQGRDEGDLPCPCTPSQVMKDQYQALKRQVERLWAHENEMEAARLRNMSSPSRKTAEELHAEAMFDQTIRFVNGAYEVGLIWKKGMDHRHLPQNYWEARKIFLAQEKRMEKDPKLLEEYVKVCRNWIREHSFVEIPNSPGTWGFYIPHFMVIRMDKATTKYRLVMHGAMEFEGRSINHLLLGGSNQIGNLLYILLRMRRGRFVLTGDVEAMFMRIQVRQEDCVGLRIFFRESPKDALKVLEGRKHLFGLTSSPFVAVKTMKFHAQANQQIWPLACEVVHQDMMVDDFCVGHDSMDHLLEVRREMELLCGSMGMRVHKYAANHPALLKDIRSEDIACTLEIGDPSDKLAPPPPDLPNIKTLGMLWETAEDVYRFRWSHEPRTEWTKRSICSVAGQFFDPMGLVTPVTILGKLIVQHLWRLDLEWDEVILDNIVTEWETYLQELPGVAEMKIPRWIAATDRVSSVLLVGFADASLVAQAAVVYQVTEESEGSRCSRILCSKAKVSPLRKQETVARLELQAAVMTVELMREVAIAFRIDLNEVQYFTDSTTVLWWLRSVKALPVFVANRVTKILDLSSVKQWKHVKTSENPADLPTRGLTPSALRQETLWWNGPDFLLVPQVEWPAQPDIWETEAASLETRKLESHLERLHFNQGVVPILSEVQCDLLLRLGRFSSLRKGIRAIANLKCFLRRKKGLGHDEENRCRVEEDLLAQVVRIDQLRTFSEEITAINLGEPVNFIEAGCRPWLDDQGMLRVAGRLRYLTRLPPQMRSPIVLASHSPLAFEILKDIHQHDLQHTGGVRGLVGASRHLWWIISATRIAKKVLKACTWCARKNLQVVGAEVAPLNWTRVGETYDVRAFQHVGIDMAGPFEVKAGPGKPRHKRWLIIFSCCTTRAVNVEMVYDASAKSCSMCLERHCNTYGIPLTISTDNGGNFVRTRKQVDELWRVWSDNASFWEQRFPQIRWWLNPPYTPRWGGHFEIAVKAVKEAMSRIVQWPHILLNDEEFCTLLKEVQLLLNLRPLVEPSPDLSDGPPLRPCDFLLTGNPIMGLPPVEERYYSFRERREELDKALREVREQFHQEYLTALNKTRRGISNPNRVEIGDIVYVTNPPVKGRDLPLGYVRSVRRGIDHEVRNVEIVTTRGNLWRTLDNFLLLERIPHPERTRLLNDVKFKKKKKNCQPSSKLHGGLKFSF